MSKGLRVTFCGNCVNYTVRLECANGWVLNGNPSIERPHTTMEGHCRDKMPFALLVQTERSCLNCDYLYPNKDSCRWTMEHQQSVPEWCSVQLEHPIINRLNCRQRPYYNCHTWKPKTQEVK